MLSVDKFSVLLHQLEQLDRLVPDNSHGLRIRGEAILHSFLRYSDFERGAVWLFDDHSLKLAATGGDWQPAQTLDLEMSADMLHRRSDQGALESFAAGSDLSPLPDAVIPLRRGDLLHGVVALRREGAGESSDSEVQLLRAAGMHLSAVLCNQKLAAEARQVGFLTKVHELELESIYDIGLSIASTLNFDELTDEILMRSVTLLNARRAALYLRQTGRFVLHRSFGEIGSEDIRRDLTEDAADDLLEEGRSLTQTSDARAIFPGCVSAVAVPIRSERGVIGVLAAADREFRDGVGPFEPADIRTLSMFASQAAIALENARLHRQALEKQAMERELELAATIQRDILPRQVVAPPGFDLDVWTRPAKQLGGDYHAFMATDTATSFCVADVSGKSTPAAILVSACHAALQLLFDEGRELDDIATELNRHIHRWSSQNKFITLILATIDREQRLLRYVNAGHNPAYLVAGGEISPLHSHGLPIGMMPGSSYEVMTIPFEPGSLLVLYSDGITEAENGPGEEFGYDRLTEVIEANADSTCRDIRDVIVAAVDHFTIGQSQTDDQTLVLVRTE